MGALLVAQTVKNLPAMQETQEMWVQFLGEEDPLEEGMATYSSILVWRISWTEEPDELQSSQTRLSDFTFTFHFPALEKEMATHSILLAWRIPGMGEPGGLQFMGPQRVRHLSVYALMQA